MCGFKNYSLSPLKAMPFFTQTDDSLTKSFAITRAKNYTELGIEIIFSLGDTINFQYILINCGLYVIILMPTSSVRRFALEKTFSLVLHRLA